MCSYNVVRVGPRDASSSSNIAAITPLNLCCRLVSWYEKKFDVGALLETHGLEPEFASAKFAFWVHGVKSNFHTRRCN